MAMTYTETAAWNTAGANSTNTAYKDVTVTASAGDLLVAFAIGANYSNTAGTRAIYTQSGTTSAWTLASPTVTADGDVEPCAGWATVTTGGSITVRSDLRCKGLYMGVGVFVIPAAEWTGTPSVSTTFVNDADGQASTTLSATSTVLYGAGDWTASNPTTTNTPSGATNRTTYYDTTNYAVAVRSWTGQASGTRNYGPSGLTSKDYSGVVVIVAEPGASSFTGSAASTLPALTQAASNASSGSRLFSTTPSVAATTDDAVTVGVEFYSNTINKTLTKIGFLAPSSGGDTSTRYCALYISSGLSSGGTVSGPHAMPTPTAGQWCWYTLPTPVALTQNERYRAAVWHDTNAGYAATGSYFTSGDGATTTTIDEFLVRPNTTDALANRQGSYTYGAAIDYPASTFSGSNYWVDVEVAGATASTGAGTTTLGSLTQAASGTFSAAGVTGTSALTLPALTQAAEGTRIVPESTGGATSALPSLTQSGAGTHTAPIYTAAIATALPALTQCARQSTSSQVPVVGGTVGAVGGSLGRVA